VTTIPNAAATPRRNALIIWSVVFLGVLVWSSIEPKDRLTWWLEVGPALIAAAVLAATMRRFPLTRLVYWLILAHAIVLMVGGHYTYAEVPLFDWLREPFGWERNNYDKVGHFMQGFVPALIARELLLRLTPLTRGAWLNYLVVSAVLAISAFYELIEWWVALLSKTAADAFLGTQGYVWDTQSDMAWALFGAVVCIVLLARRHDEQLAALLGTNGATGPTRPSSG
jgi:putative membrane protein